MDTFSTLHHDDLDSLQLNENYENDDHVQEIDTNVQHEASRENFNTTYNLFRIQSMTKQEYWLTSILSFWTIVFSFVGFAAFTQEERANIVGLIVNLNLVVFYGAPLGTILKVCESKNSSSIHRRTVCEYFL